MGVVVFSVISWRCRLLDINGELINESNICHIINTDNGLVCFCCHINLNCTATVLKNILCSSFRPDTVTHVGHLSPTHSHCSTCTKETDSEPHWARVQSFTQKHCDDNTHVLFCSVPRDTTRAVLLETWWIQSSEFWLYEMLRLWGDGTVDNLSVSLSSCLSLHLWAPLNWLLQLGESNGNSQWSLTGCKPPSYVCVCVCVCVCVGRHVG